MKQLIKNNPETIKEVFNGSTTFLSRMLITKKLLKEVGKEIQIKKRLRGDKWYHKNLMMKESYYEVVDREKDNGDSKKIFPSFFQKSNIY